MSTVTATFATRRDAEMAIEHIVQDHGVDRTAVSVGPTGPENTVGDDPAGADADRMVPTSGAKLSGSITVSVGTENAAMIQQITDVFQEFNAESIT